MTRVVTMDGEEGNGDGGDEDENEDNLLQVESTYKDIHIYKDTMLNRP